MEQGHVFGVSLDFSVRFGPANAGCAFPINSRELMATTLKEIVRFEGDMIKETFKGAFACACLIGDSGMIAVQTHRGSKLLLCDMYDLAHPLCECESETNGVFHLAYFPGSKSLVAIGSGVAVYTISYARLRTSCPSVSCTLRSQFAPGYDTTLLSPPCFDDKNELIFLPTKDGVRAFDFDGKARMLATKLPAEGPTVFAFSRDTGKMLTSDPENGLCLWAKNGTLAQRYGIAGGSILAMAFVDSENVVFLNAYAAIYAMNIKTGRPFQCYHVDEHPARFSLFWQRGEPKIGLCIGGCFEQLSVTVPWKVWTMNVYRAKAIQRCNKMDKAARVFVETENSYAKIYSPKTAKMLTSATSRESSRLVEMLYDRGVFTWYKWVEDLCKYVEEHVFLAEGHDRLLMVMDDGACLSYDPGCVPAELRAKREIRAVSIQLVCHHDQYMFAVATSDGYLVLYDYDTWEERQRFNLGKLGPIGIKYVHETKSCVVLFDGKMALYDLEAAKFTDWATSRVATACSVHGTLFVIGFEDGEIVRYELRNRTFEVVKTEAVPNPHTEKVTGFAFGVDRWLSCSLDCVVLVWDYKQNLVSRIVLPFPIYTIHLLNGKRHLLVAMENEIMQIDGSIIFREVDPEDKRIDNYDELDDPLNPEHVAELKMKSDEPSDYKRSQAKKTPRTKKSPMKARIAGLRQQLAGAQGPNNTPAKPAAVTEEDEQEKQRKVEEMKKMLQDEEIARERLAKQAEDIRANQASGGPPKEGGEEQQNNDEDNTEDVHEEEQEDDVEGTKAKGESKGKKKKPPPSPRSAVDFLKESMDQEGKKKRKRKAKRAHDDEDKDKGEKEPPAPADPEKLKNLLRSHQNQMKQMSHTGKDRGNEGPRRRIETDITKMSFMECTTSVTDPEGGNDDETPKKKKRTRRQKKSGSSPGDKDTEEDYDGYTESDSISDDDDGNDTAKRERRPRKPKKAAGHGTKTRKKVRSGEKEDSDEYDDDETYSDDDDAKPVKASNVASTARKRTRPSLQNSPRSGKPRTTDYSDDERENVQDSDKVTHPRRKRATKGPTASHVSEHLSANTATSISEPISAPGSTASPRRNNNRKLNTVRQIWIDRELNRSQTPAPVRWNQLRTRQRRKGAKTPPMRGHKRYFGIPSPNIVLDHQAVLRMYGRGHTELLPAIHRLVREGKIDESEIPTPGIYADGDQSHPFITRSFKFPSKQGLMARAPRSGKLVHGDGYDHPGSPAVPIDPFCPRPPNVQGKATPGKRIDVHLNLPIPVEDEQVYVSSPRHLAPMSLNDKRNLSPRDFPSTEKLQNRNTQSLEVIEKVNFSHTYQQPLSGRRVSFDLSKDTSTEIEPVFSPRRPFTDFDPHVDTTEPESEDLEKPLSAPYEVKEIRQKPLAMTTQIRIAPPEPMFTSTPRRMRAERSFDILRTIMPLPKKRAPPPPIGRAVTGRVADRLKQKHISPKAATPRVKPVFFADDDEDEGVELTGFSSLYASISGGSVVTVQRKPTKTKRRAPAILSMSQPLYFRHRH